MPQQGTDRLHCNALGAVTHARQIKQAKLHDQQAQHLRVCGTGALLGCVWMVLCLDVYGWVIACVYGQVLWVGVWMGAIICPANPAPGLVYGQVLRRDGRCCMKDACAISTKRTR